MSIFAWEAQQPDGEWRIIGLAMPDGTMMPLVSTNFGPIGDATAYVHAHNKQTGFPIRCMQYEESDLLFMADANGRAMCVDCGEPHLAVTCPACGRENDHHHGVDPAAVPKPGDYAMCWKCGGIAVFTDELTLRLPTEEEIAAADADEDVQRVKQVVETTRTPSEALRVLRESEG